MMPAPAIQRFIAVASLFGGLIVAMAIAAVFAIRYIGERANASVAAVRELSELEEGARDAEAAGAVLANLAQEETAIRQSFIDPAQPLPFIEGVEALGKRLSLKISLALTGGTPGEAYFITTRGSLATILAFLRGLETFPIFVAIGDFELRSTGVGAVEPQVDLTLTIRPLRP